MQSFRTHRYHPALCPTCTTIVNLNVASTDRRCPSCGREDVVPYGLQTRAPSEEHEPPSQYDDRATLAGRHTCPKCRTYALTFGKMTRIFFD